MAKPRLKKTFKFIGIILAVLIAIISIAPILLYNHQQGVLSTIVDDLNEGQNGHLEIGKARISPFKQFPYISLRIDSIYFYDDAHTDAKPIYCIERLYIGFNAWKLLKGEYEIKELTVQGGYANLITYPDGSINLLVAKSGKEEKTEEAEEGEEKLDLSFEKLRIQDFVIDKENRELHHHFKMRIDKAELDINYQEDIVDSRLEADCVLEDISMENVHFLKGKPIGLLFNGKYDLNTAHLTLRESMIELSQTKLGISGTVDTQDSLLLDLAIEGKKDDFSLLTAFAPEDIQKTLKKYDNQGDIFFKGAIKGYSTDYQNPAINIDFGCKNAWFLNPNKDHRLEELNFVGHFKNGEKRNLASSEFLLESLSGTPEKGKFTGSFHIVNFEHPQIDLDLSANLDLEALQEFMKVDALEDMKGVLSINISLNELIDPDDMATASDRIREGAKSRVELKDFSIKLAGFPHLIENVHGEITLDNGDLKLEDFSFTVDSSHIAINGIVTHFLDYIHREPADMKWELIGKADEIDFDRLFAHDSAMQSITHEAIYDLDFDFIFQTKTTELSKPVGLPNGEFFIEQFACKLREFPHRFHDFKADILLTPNKIEVKDFSGEIDDSDFHISGFVDGYESLEREDTTANVQFFMDLVSNSLHLDDLFTYRDVNYLPAEYSTETLKDFEIIADLSTTNQALRVEKSIPDLKLNLKDVHFLMQGHKRKFKNIHGDFSIQGDDLEIKNFTGNLGQSDFHINATAHHIFDSVTNSQYQVELKAKNLNFDELLDYETKKATVTKPIKVNHDSVFNLFAEPFPALDFKANIGRMVYHRFKFSQLGFDVRTTPDHYVYIDTLHGNGAGGKIDMSGYFNASDKDHIYFSSVLNFDKVDIDQLFYKFDNFGQDYLLSENLHGKLTAIIKSKVRMHADLTPYLEESTAHIEATIKDGEILDYAPFHAMAEYFGDKDLDKVRFGELVNTFDVKDGILSIPSMTINSTLGFMDITGTQSAKDDMKMDYTMRV
ncbi:MAG: hypothetical protein ACI81T_003069, partial [Bacteroidia bacterium]